MSAEAPGHGHEKSKSHESHGAAHDGWFNDASKVVGEGLKAVGIGYITAVGASILLPALGIIAPAYMYLVAGYAAAVRSLLKGGEGGGSKPAAHGAH